MRELERTVDFVGRDVVEKLTLVAFGQRFPIFAGGLKQRERTHHICAGKGEWVFDRAVDVALGSQMNNAVDFMFADDLAHSIKVGDVGAHEGVVGSILDVAQVGQISGVCQLVEVDDIVVWIFVDKQPHHVRSDESGTAGYENIHNCRLVKVLVIIKRRYKIGQQWVTQILVGKDSFGGVEAPVDT